MNEKKKRKNVNFRLDSALYGEMMAAIAEVGSSSMSDFMRRAIVNQIKREKAFAPS